jgi:hypothetical protein
MNVIFLDIDGVLNRHGNGKDFEPDCVAAFNRVVKATNAELVISSSWRHMIIGGHMSLLGFGKLLRSHGIHGTSVIGHTRSARSDEPRALEIADWLRENRSPDGVRKVCILDDDPDAFGGRPGVQTAGGVGLTETDADLAIDILVGG